MAKVVGPVHDEAVGEADEELGSIDEGIEIEGLATEEGGADNDGVLEGAGVLEEPETALAYVQSKHPISKKDCRLGS